MHIILGYELDTGSYPDALGNDEARQGIVVLGPAGLVGVLETRPGLTRIQTHQAIRIGQYLKRLKEADNNERFYSKSIHVDAWSTAKQVLAWRDEPKKSRKYRSLKTRSGVNLSSSRKATRSFSINSSGFFDMAVRS